MIPFANTVSTFLRKPKIVTTPAAMTIGGAARIPSTTRPVLANAVIRITVSDGDDRSVNLEIETAIGSGVYTSVSRLRRTIDTTGLGVTSTAINEDTVQAWVPAGFGYRFTQTGSGTTAIVFQNEQTF